MLYSSCKRGHCKLKRLTLWALCFQRRGTNPPPPTQIRLQIKAQLQAQVLMHLPPSPKSQRCLRSAVVSSPHKFAQPGSTNSPHYYHPQQPPSNTCKPLLCIGTVSFSEKPCCPCTRRRKGGKCGRAQELRCQYRDSYQASIQHPVSVGQEKEKAVAATLEEDGDGGFFYCYNRSVFENTKRDLGCDVPDTKCDPEMQNDLASVDGSICQESLEKETFPYWKQGESSSAPCIEYKQVSALPLSNLVKKSTMDLNEPQDALSVKSFDHLHNMNGANPDLKTLINPPVLLSSQNFSDVSTKLSGLTFCPRKGSGEHMTTKPQEKLQNETLSVCSNLSKSSMTSENPHWCTSEGQCSSLSTAVVNASQKCEPVIVGGQQVRRSESAGSEVPQLHVVKCKNSTAFKLVSPKSSRKKMVIPDAAQPGSVLIARRSEHQIESQSQTDEHQEKKEQDVSKAASAHQRPDHLALGPVHPLFLGLASLTGCRDRMGRAIVELYGDHQGWRSAVTSQELFQMLLYFHYITRKEIRDAGLTLIFDAKKRNPEPELYKAIMLLHELNPQAVNSLVLMVDKESNNQPQKCPGIQTEVVTSLKTLFKLVEAKQLSSRLEGGLSHSYCDWLELHQKLFPFVCDLHEVSNLLLRAFTKLEERLRRDTVQNVQQCILDKRTLMRDILEDHQLVRLQRESGAILAHLRKESDFNYPHCKDLSDAVDSVTSLYNHVGEQAHVLVQRSYVLLEHLEYLLQLKEMEEHFIQIQLWFNTEGERQLLEVESVEHSGDRMEQILNSFTGFLIEANDRRNHALSLVSEAQQLQHRGLSYSETGMFGALVCTFKSCLEDFMYRAEACGRELQIMVNICDFCEQATALAKECNDYLDQNQFIIHSSQDKKQDSSSNSDTKATQYLLEKYGSGPSTSANHFVLQSFQDRFLHFSPEKFQEVKAQASALKGSWGMQLWNVAWLKCQEACQQLEERIQEVDLVNQPPSANSSWQIGHYVNVMSTNVQTVSPGGQTLVVQSTLGPQHPLWEDIVSGAVDVGKRKPILSTNTPSSANVACCNIIIKPEDGSDPKSIQGSNVTPPSPERPTRKSERESRRRQTNRARSVRDAAARSQSHTVGCQWFPWRRGRVPRSVSQDSGTKGAVTAGLSIPPEQQGRPSSSCSQHGQPSCKIFQEAQKFQISRHGSFCSYDSCMSGQKAAGDKHSSLPFRKYEETFCSQSPLQSTNNAVRLQRVMEELVFTEREYVRSLGYILTHYFPLMDRPDIPQELRGKQGIIFGNLEKLYNFHSHHFLPELETCHREPATVARCFLRHSESFGLYALYSKNKPRSDGLILHCHHDIFKRKQQELGDMMDLSSYLLRPIQRISKYSLLLQDMLALSGSHRPTEFTSSGCGSSPYVPVLTGSDMEREMAEVEAAADLVRFQMRHGNDLLTMDAIQDCDVNLKEQGQLVRQDEFTVFFKKKKCIRRVFLFEDLIIFSKTKRTDVGNDVYMYKQSFKTSDIGMTHNSTMSGLCFEIWFRRRKSEYTYTLKASSIELKRVWTNDLERILWNQASHSRGYLQQHHVAHFFV
uniref:Pleckstrin homology domain-containing family G member 4B-like n=1 Tax=Gouania willdenowi TaxID=441366 RepID=A0A8C5GCG4_GOUWI